MDHSHHTSITIDLNALRHNLKEIRKLAPGKKVMGIVKKNAYGHGLVGAAKGLVSEGVDYLGVIYPEEGITLREAGVTCPILVLGATLPEDLPQCLEHDLELAILSIDHLHEMEKAVSATKLKAKVHLKIDTGMGRIGSAWHSSGAFISETLSADFVEIKGIFTHLACADLPGDSFSSEQVRRFEIVLKQFEDLAGWRPMAHMAASGGILHYPETHFDMIRPGHLLYGVLPDTGADQILDLQPVLSLYTKVVFVKKIKKGETVGYGNKWAAPKDTHIATIALGYGDGYSRKLTGKGVRVIVNGQSMPIVGSVCMDQIMIDTGETPLAIGTQVVVIGKEGNHEVHVHELADLQATVPDDVLSGLNWHIPRTFLKTT